MNRLITRFLVAAAVGLFGVLSYCTTSVYNPITGESQRVSLSPKQEVVLGLQARSQMAAQYGGLYPNPTLQEYIDQVGQRVVQRSNARESGYPFEFHLLRDPNTINAFALPGGQIFITAGLLRRLQSEAQLAGVLGHEAGHVVGRHAAEHLAKQQLGQSLVTAVGIATTDEQTGNRNAQVIAQAVNQVVQLRYGREDELESDRLGFRFMTEAGYNPQGMLGLLAVLQNARKSGSSPEFFSTHPNPENRIQRIEELLAQTFPNGIPPGLEEGQQDFMQTVLARLR